MTVWHSFACSDLFLGFGALGSALWPLSVEPLDPSCPSRAESWLVHDVAFLNHLLLFLLFLKLPLKPIKCFLSLQLLLLLLSRAWRSCSWLIQLGRKDKAFMVLLALRSSNRCFLCFLRPSSVWTASRKPWFSIFRSVSSMLSFSNVSPSFLTPVQALLTQQTAQAVLFSPVCITYSGRTGW